MYLFNMAGESFFPIVVRVAKRETNFHTHARPLCFGSHVHVSRDARVVRASDM